MLTSGVSFSSPTYPPNTMEKLNYMLQIWIPKNSLSTPPYPTLIEISYNQSHVFQLLCNPTFYQQHYPPKKDKLFPPLLDVEPPPNTPSLSTNTYLSCRPPTSGNYLTPFLISIPLKLPSSATPYHNKP